MTEVTRILSAIEKGDTRAVDELLPIVYQELRVLATQKLARESPGQTLQPTALVHEAYLRLVNVEARNYRNRGHFFATAAEAMRRILIDNARRKQSLKRGGARHRIDLDDVDVSTDGPSDDLLALDEALNKLAQTDPLKADLIKLRHFVGLTLEQAADALGLPPRTAKRHWAYARAWLFREMTDGDESGTKDT